MKKLLFFVVLLFLLESCNQQSSIREGVSFPDNISPLYFLEKLNVPSALVVVIDSIPFIVSKNTLEEWKKNNNIDITQAVMYATSELLYYKDIGYINVYTGFNQEYLDWYENQHDYDNVINPLYSNDKMEVFEFKIIPDFFYLLMIAKSDSLIIAGYKENIPEDSLFLGNDVIMDVKYSREYILGLLPIFKPKDRAKLGRASD